MDENHGRFIRHSIQIAQRARDNGNHPFGALLVDAQGQILLEAENTVVTQRDCTGHAEANLMRLASSQFDSDFLANCTLYTSTEPCPMCAGAIFWGNVRRVVFGLSMEGLYDLIGPGNEDSLVLPCRQVFEHGKKPVEVIGPILEEEARVVHQNFWDRL
ncbi:MAG: nucleoside deaminase [Anaerolineales bacterium]|jgi:tRNA(Arg) A34 adenosine deaminase TadA